MDCSHCGHSGRDDARFCGACGHALSRTCRSCDRDLRPGARFCDGCGAEIARAPQPREPRDYTPRHLAERILTTRAALQGERKHVTVLFADVKGSVALSDVLGAEEWHEVLDELFEILAEGVHRFEGTVNQYTGDGIMAIFGAPLALEDHAQRACHAALLLRDRLRDHAHRLRVQRGIDLRVRLALNSGEVVVGAIGDDLRMDYTAQGATVGLAARIQEVTAPERVYVSESTASLAGGWFDLRSLGATAFKGLESPMHLYELERAAAPRTRLDVARAHGLTPFVGRSDELAVLERALDRAGAGEGQLIGVVGEAGVGKSRLCLEFAQLVSERGVPVVAAACPSHAPTLPHFLIRELVRGLLGLDRAAIGGAETTVAIAERLRALDAGLVEQLGLLLELLQLPDPEVPPPALDAEAKRRLLVDTLQRVVAGRSRDELQVVLLDDLHWIDAESDALLAEIVDGLPPTRALILTNFRPEYQAGWMRRTHYQQVGLQALAGHRSSELLGALLGDDPSLRPLAERVDEATRGNPFFAEEVVRGLVERGALAGELGRYRMADAEAAPAIPSRVQSVLAARIDRLPERHKSVLQAAAVVGRRFRATLAARVAGLAQADALASLDALCAAELLRREEVPGEHQYAFCHPLTHEVAYETQLRSQRRRLHAALAWTLAQEPAAALEEAASLVAHHLEQSGHVLEAAHWRWRAAEAIGWSDAAALVPHLRHVMRLTDALSDDHEAVRLGIRARTRGVADALLSDRPFEEGERWFREGEFAARRLAHLPALATLNGWYANFLSGHGRTEEADARAEVALRLARESGSPRALIGISYGVLQALGRQGRFPDGLAFAEQVVEAARGQRHEADRVVAEHARLSRADFLVQLGRLHEAIQAAEELPRLGAASYHPQVSVGGALCKAEASFFLGDFEFQLSAARAAVELVEAWQSDHWLDQAHRQVAHALLCLGRPAEALAACGAASAMDREGTWDGWAGKRELLRARALAELGRRDEALHELELGWERAQPRAHADTGLWSHWHMLQALFAADPGAHARIEEHLGALDMVVRRCGASVWIPYARLARAELADGLGEAAEAARQREAAAKELRAMGARRAAERVEARLAQPVA